MQTVEHVLAALTAGQVNRFHTKRLNHAPNVAEHSCNVALIAYALCDGVPSVALIMACLTHDHGEAWTGDVPSPVKRADPAVNAVFERLEEEARINHLGLTFPRLTFWEARLLDAADKLDGCFTCYFEAQSGNQRLLRTWGRYLDYLDEFTDSMPELFSQLRGFLRKEHNHANCK